MLGRHGETGLEVEQRPDLLDVAFLLLGEMKA
jgi:hypothetical protein